MSSSASHYVTNNVRKLSVKQRARSVPSMVQLPSLAIDESSQIAKEPEEVLIKIESDPNTEMKHQGTTSLVKGKTFLCLSFLTLYYF